MKIKKLLSAVLICMMVVCSVSMTAFASNWWDDLLDGDGELSGDLILGGDTNLGESFATLADLQAEIDEFAADGGEPVINITSPITLPAGEEFTLDLKGCAVVMSKECTASFSMIENNGTLIIDDSVGGGKISFKDTGAGDPEYHWGSYTINNRGTLIVNGGTIENTSEQNIGGVCHMYCAIQQASGSTTINGGTISNETYRSVRINGGSLEITGGEFVGQVWLQPNQGDATIAVSGGTFAPSGVDGSSIFMTNAGENYTVSNASISGGTFTTKIGCTVPSELAGAITGGTFSAAAVSGTNEALLAENVGFVDNGDGTFGAVEEAIEGEAAIDGEGFATLAEAVAAAEAGDTITLLRDVTISEPLKIEKTVAIDGAGHTITYTGSNRAITVENTAAGADLTISNLTVDCTASYCERGINYNTTGTLTLTNVTAGGEGVTYALNLPSSSNGATVNLTGCELTGCIALNIWGADATVKATDTTFTSVDKSNSEGYAAIMLNKPATGTVVNVVGGSIYADDDSYAVLKDAEATVKVSDTTSVTGIYGEGVALVSFPGTDNFYSCDSVERAVELAVEGSVVTLIKDVTMSDILVINKAIVLDGNGKTLTSTAGRAINVSGADGVTIKNLTINASGERAINVIQNATNVTIDNVTATAANYTVNVASSASNAVVAISNSTLDGLCTVNVAAAGANVTVDNSTVNCNDNNTTAGESYAALCLNKEAVGGSIIATNTTINVTEGSDSTATRNGAENGTVTVDGSAEGVPTMVAVITYPGQTSYHSFTTLAKAVEFAKAGDTITLINDVTISEPLKIEKTVAIDGAGHTITYTGSNRAITVENTAAGADLTISNLTVDCTASYCQRGINYNTTGTLTLTNVKVKGESTYALNLPGSSVGATVAITDCELTGKIALNIWGANSTITVTDSVLTSVDNTTSENYGAIVLNNDGVTVANGVTLTVNGGSIVALNEKGEPSNALINNTDSTVTISEETVVNGESEASVIIVSYPGSDNYYSCNSLADAIEVANNAKITLLKDIVLTEAITIPADFATTIDLAGCKITYGSAVIADEEALASIFAVAEGYECVVNSDGTISVVEITEEKLDTVIAFIKKSYTYTDEETGEEKNGYKVSILAGIDSLNYRRVGFEFTCGSEISATLDTKKVYTDFTAAGIKHNPDRFGADCEYIFAVTGKLPANGEKIVARAFAETLDGDYIYSDYYASSELN